MLQYQLLSTADGSVPGKYKLFIKETNKTMHKKFCLLFDVRNLNLNQLQSKYYD